jgi:hypothetical protein
MSRRNPKRSSTNDMTKKTLKTKDIETKTPCVECPPILQPPSPLPSKKRNTKVLCASHANIYSGLILTLKVLFVLIKSEWKSY